MSLWFESLSYCLYDSGDDHESRAKCILSHLSMDVPRSWWERALKTSNVSSSYASILHDMRKELLKIRVSQKRLSLAYLLRWYLPMMISKSRNQDLVPLIVNIR
jgi:hypothetical protein